MPSIRTVLLCVAVLWATQGQLAAVSRVFLFPTGDSNLVSVLRADDLSLEGSIPTPSSAFAVFGAANRTKYYILSRTSTDSVLVVDSQTLNVTKRFDLGATSSAGVLTPDGKYVLIAAGQVRVIRTDTDQEVGAGIAVGGAPVQIVVNNSSSRAYVLIDSGRLIQVIDLDTLQIIKTITASGTSSISLTSDGSRLVAVFSGGVRQFRTTDYDLINTIEGQFSIANSISHPVPGVTKVLVQNQGAGLASTSQLFDLDQRTARPVGDIGSTKLEEVVVVNAQRAFAIVNNALAEIDLTASSPTVTPLGFGENSIGLALSPNRKTLFLSSLTQATATKVNLVTDTVERSTTVPFGPSGHGLVFDRSPGPPAELTIVGGDNQFAPPGTTLAVPLTVRVLDADGAPIAGAPVLFAATGSVAVELKPAQPSITNERGIATATVTFPEAVAPDDEPAGQQAAAVVEQADGQDSPAVNEKSESGGVAGKAAQLEPVRQSEEVLQSIIIGATAEKAPPAAFTVTIIRGVGLIKISGDFQVAAPREPFPEPFVVLATDRDGAPVAPGTTVSFTPFLANCRKDVPTDPNGFASAECDALDVQLGAGTVQEGSLTASLPDLLEELGFELTSANFKFSVAVGANTIGMMKLSGDEQRAPTGQALPMPLSFRLTSTFGGTGQIGVRIRQLSGPPAVITPRFLTTRPGFNESVNVTLGPNAGSIVIEAVASAPKLPSVRFNITATGGQPATIQKAGDGQSGRIGSELQNPLRVTVINESGDVVAFPQVNWTLLEGDATLITASTASAATARVVLGDTPGAVRVQAKVGALETVFNVTATPPQPVAISTISGQNQTLTVGVLSEPLRVRVSEVNNQPSANLAVTFSGPPNVLLHPLEGGEPGNPLVQTTGADGVTGVRAELLATTASLREAGAAKGQFSSTVTITATAGEDLNTTFLLNVIGRAPLFESTGVVNAASFEAGIVPGSLATLFGVGLSEGISGTVLVGGDTAFAGTSVRIGGIPAPLLSITGGPNEQINLQVPFEISPGRTTTVEVINNGARSTVRGVVVFPSQPGIFNVPLGDGGSVGAVIHADGSLVTPDNPAARGEVVSLFLTGGGSITPTVATGVIAPPSPLSLMTQPVVVGVDNKGSTVRFTGYAPNFLGLYQINFEVARDAQCGLVRLNVKVGDVVSAVSNTAVQCP